MDAENGSESIPAAPKRKNAYTGKTILCPHCGESVLVHFSVDICKTEVPPPSGPPHANPVDQWRNTLTSSQTGALDAARRSGLFDSYEWALRNTSTPIPKNTEKSFLEWFKMCRSTAIPSWALKQFRELYPEKLIEFYAHQQVGAVVAGHEVSLFLPMEILTGMKVEMGGPAGPRQTLPPDVKGVQQWIKTKMGYVPVGARIAMSAMRRRCIGEFGKPLI